MTDSRTLAEVMVDRANTVLKKARCKARAYEFAMWDIFSPNLTMSPSKVGIRVELPKHLKEAEPKRREFDDRMRHKIAFKRWLKRCSKYRAGHIEKAKKALRAGCIRYRSRHDSYELLIHI